MQPRHWGECVLWMRLAGYDIELIPYREWMDILRETSGAAGRIGSWRVLNGDTGAVLKSGSGAGVITFSSVSAKKITFDITGASGTPSLKVE